MKQNLQRIMKLALLLFKLRMLIIQVQELIKTISLQLGLCLIANMYLQDHNKAFFIYIGNLVIVAFFRNILII